MVSYERRELLAQVAEMYFVQGLSQAAIGLSLEFSRSKVSRLLTEARERGIVEVRVNHPLERDLELERRIIDLFALNKVIVLRTGNMTPNQMLQSLGRLGANYLTDLLDDGSTLGISWGTAVYEVARAIRYRVLEDFSVVQIIGAIGYGDPTIDGPEVARHIAAALSGKYFTLNAPVIVQDEATRESLLNERNIREALEKVAQANYVLVGIGSSDPARSGFVRAGYLSPGEMDEIIRESGAVGDIGACLYDEYGRHKEIAFNNRIIGISLEELQSIPAEVVGVAGGLEKAKPVLGALRGSLIDTLVTDDHAAREVLALHAAKSSATYA